jgi:hypothetical protein
VTENAKAGQSILSTPRLSLWIAAGGRLRLAGAGAVLLLVGAIAGFWVGLEGSFHDMEEVRALNQQLQSESQRLKGQITEESADLAAQQARLTRIQSVLESIMPSENTYSVNPNQSMIVAEGHLTIGLIGSPATDAVDLNINGKQQSATAGDVITITPDPSTTCQVAVQSFDMFKAILTASCAAPKPN